MKLPRDVAGRQLVRALRALGYYQTRQKGSHIHITTRQNGEPHEVVPDHNPIKCGTLNWSGFPTSVSYGTWMIKNFRGALGSTINITLKPP
jgi:predicted RNA binding protein YcfA (HicA-like mRNA interferase family)